MRKLLCLILLCVAMQYKNAAATEYHEVIEVKCLPVFNKFTFMTFAVSDINYDLLKNQEQPFKELQKQLEKSGYSFIPPKGYTAKCNLPGSEARRVKDKKLELKVFYNGKQKLHRGLNIPVNYQLYINNDLVVEDAFQVGSRLGDYQYTYMLSIEGYHHTLTMCGAYEEGHTCKRIKLDDLSGIKKPTGLKRESLEPGNWRSEQEEKKH